MCAPIVHPPFLPKCDARQARSRPWWHGHRVHLARAELSLPCCASPRFPVLSQRILSGSMLTAAPRQWKLIGLAVDLLSVVELITGCGTSWGSTSAGCEKSWCRRMLLLLAMRICDSLEPHASVLRCPWPWSRCLGDLLNPSSFFGAVRSLHTAR